MVPSHSKATRTVDGSSVGGRGGGGGGRAAGGARLAEAALSGEGDALAGGEGLVAAGAAEAGLVVGLAQGRHHLALHELAALVALGAEVGLVARRAVVVLVAGEETCGDDNGSPDMSVSRLSH